MALSYTAFKNLELSLYPNTTKPTIRVQVFYEMNVLNFQKNIGYKMERAFKNLEGVVNVDAQYAPSITTYMIKFDWGTNSQQAYQYAAAAAALYQNKLPDNARPIKTSYYDPGLELYVAVKSKSISAETLSLRLKQRLEPKINNIRGISSVYISPIMDREVSIKVNPQLLVENGLSIETVVDSLEKAKFDYSLGTLKEDTKNIDLLVIQKTSVNSISELRNLPIDINYQRVIKLKDIAKVTLQTRIQDRVFKYNDEQVIAIAAWPLPSGNIYDIAVEFKNVVMSEVGDNNDVIVINSPINYINESIEQMLVAILAGMLFAGISIAVAFKKFRMTLIISSTMPISILISVCALISFGLGINIITICAAGIAIGMVIDPAVYIVEKIKKNLQNNTSCKSTSEIVSSTVKGSYKTIVTTTISTMAVFIPLTFTQPIVKALLADFVIVIITLLIASLLISTLLIPTLITLLYRVNEKNTKEIWRKEKPRTNNKILEKIITKNIISIPIAIIAFTLFIEAINIVKNEIRREVVAQPLPNIIDVGIKMNSSELSEKEKNKLITPIYNTIKNHHHDRIKFIFIDIRKDIAYLSLHLSNNHEISKLISELRARITPNEHYDIDISPWVSASLKVEDIPSVRVMVTGTSHEDSMLQLQDAFRQLKKNEQVIKIKSYPRVKASQKLSLTVKEELLSLSQNEASFSAYKNSVNALIKYSTEPNYRYDINIGAQNIPIMLQLGSERSHNVDELKARPIVMNGEIYNISDFVSFNETKSYDRYFSRNTAQVYLLEVWLNDSTVKPKKYIENALNNGNVYTVQSSNEEIESNISSLVYALLCALVLVILILLLDLVKVPYVFITLCTLPSGLIGAAAALYTFDSTLSVTSLIGLILLSGLSVNNTIFIIHALNDIKLRSKSISPKQLVLEALSTRIRPILVTSFSTIFAMLPLAIGYGNSGPITQPLGLVMCGGMLSVTLFSVTLSPILLYWYESISFKRGMHKDVLIS